MRTLIWLAVTAGFAGEAAAADIINKDTNAHQLELSCDGAKTYARLRPNAIQADAVHAGCVIRVDKAKGVTVGNGNVVIVKGKAINS